MKDPFSPLTLLKVRWWLTEAWLKRQHRLVWYVVGIIMGWLVCSEYQVYLATGRWTMFPWQ
jgi:hypothetical protein